MFFFTLMIAYTFIPENWYTFYVNHITPGGWWGLWRICLLSQGMILDSGGYGHKEYPSKKKSWISNKQKFKKIKDKVET